MKFTCLYAVSFLLIFLSGYVNAEVDFRTPEREYLNDRGSWNIYIEADMQRSNSALATKSLKKLKKTLADIETKLPAHSIKKLKKLNIFLMWGEDSPKGGKKSGMRFVRKGETKNRLHYDKRWENSVVIYSAENLIYLSEMWARKAVTHELAHAWQIMHWPDRYDVIAAPWKLAKAKGLYTNVKDYKNRVKPRAYALKNNLEYFAELSAMYFVGGDYFPYDRARLSKYDPIGVKMVKKLWNVR